MRELELAGGYYEMGRRYGARLRDEGFSLDPATEEQLRFANPCEDAVREYTPELLEEMQGVADAGGLDPELVKVLPLTLYEKPGCSVVALSGRHTVGGRPLFGRNYDYLRSFGGHSELCRTNPTGGLSHIGLSDHWVGRHDGVNEAGLAIGHSGPPATRRAPGFIFTLAARAVLDRCRNVSEATELLECIPHLQNTAFLLADASGEIVAVDASPEEVRTARFESGFGFLANHFFSEKMARYQPDGWGRDHDPRDRNLRRWFEAHDGLEVSDLQHVLADPKTGACLKGDEEESDPDVTLWSWTAVLGEPGIQLARGTPGETPYEPVTSFPDRDQSTDHQRWFGLYPRSRRSGDLDPTGASFRIASEA